MKIKVNTLNDYTARIPVWFGQIKDGMVYRNGEPDFKQTRFRTAIKKTLKDLEQSERRLNIWAAKAGF